MSKSLFSFLICVSVFPFSFRALAASAPKAKPSYPFFPKDFQIRMNTLVEEIKEKSTEEGYQETELDRVILLLWSFNEPHGVLKSNSPEASNQRRAYYRQFLETIPCSFLSENEQKKLFLLFLKVKSIDEIRTLSPEISIPYEMSDSESRILFSYIILKGQGLMRNVGRKTGSVARGFHQRGQIEEHYKKMTQRFNRLLKEKNWMDKIREKCDEIQKSSLHSLPSKAFAPPSPERSFYLSAGEWAAHVAFLVKGTGSPNGEELQDQLASSLQNDLPEFATELVAELNGPSRKPVKKVIATIVNTLQESFLGAFKKAEGGLNQLLANQYSSLRSLTEDVFKDSPKVTPTESEFTFTEEEIAAFNEDLQTTKTPAQKKKKKKKNVARKSSKDELPCGGGSKAEETPSLTDPEKEEISPEEKQARKCFGRIFPGKLHHHVHRWFTESREEGESIVSPETVKTWAGYEDLSDKELKIKIYKHTLGALLPKLLNHKEVLKRYTAEHEESSVRKNFTLAASIFRLSISGNREKICDGVYKIAYDETQDASGEVTRLFYHNYLHDRAYAEEVYQAQRLQSKLVKKKQKKGKVKKKNTKDFSWMPLLQLQPEAVEREEGWVDVLPKKTPVFFDYDSSSKALIFTLRDGLDDIVMAVLPRP